MLGDVLGVCVWLALLQASDTIMDGLSGLEISTLSLGLRAWPMEPEYPLQSSARFRLMFQPLTLWRPRVA